MVQLAWLPRISIGFSSKQRAIRFQSMSHLDYPFRVKLGGRDWFISTA
jgi:hypothetical protein